jgi:hypothetical protein
MIEGAGDISAELATVTLLVVGSITLNARIASGGMAVVLLLTACSDDTSGSAATEQTIGESDESVEAAESTDGSGGPSTTGAPIPTAGPEPTGVPGLYDADPYCAAWALYSGSLQAVGVADAFGQLASIDVAELELLAAWSINGAVADIDANWPGELVEERTIVREELLGPFARRATKAIAALRAAGVTDDQLVELNKTWLTALAARNPGEPVITVPPLGDELAAKVAVAAAAFDAEVTPFSADPSLIVDSVTTPLTDVYLSTRCPELANSGVGDAV